MVPLSVSEVSSVMALVKVSTSPCSAPVLSVTCSVTGRSSTMKPRDSTPWVPVAVFSTRAVNVCVPPTSAVAGSKVQCSALPLSMVA